MTARPSLQRLCAAVVVLVGLGATGPRAAPPEQPPNPLPRGLFDEAPVFDPASDEPPPDAPTAPAGATSTSSPTTPTGDAAPTTTAVERVRLIYAPGPWASVCPGADDVPELVRQHLGRDPFGEPATRVALIALDGDGAVPVRARVELLDLGLEPLGSRVVDARDGCAELVATAAFQLALALDPLAVGAPTTTTTTTTAPVDPAGPTAPPAPVATAPAAPPPSTTPPPRAADATTTTTAEQATELFFTGGAGVAALLAPEGVMAGMQVGVGGRWSAVSARLEGRVDLSGDNRGTTSVPMLLTVLPCAHLPIVDLGTDGAFEATGCLTATAGVMPAIGVYTGFGLYAGSGLRLGLDWHIPGEITMRAFGQLEAAGLRPLLINLSSGNIYQSPPFNVLLGVAMDVPW